MMYETMTLSALPLGESAYAHRLADLGLVPGTRVTCLARSPTGNPAAYLIRGSLIALRQNDADGVHLTCKRTEAADS